MFQTNLPNVQMKHVIPVLITFFIQFSALNYYTQGKRFKKGLLEVQKHNVFKCLYGLL